MGAGWIGTVQALTFPVSAFGLLLLALVSIIRTLPALRRVHMESDASLRRASVRRSRAVQP
jgi:hypothetical protein